MSTTISINLKRASKVYHEGEIIAGVLVVESSGETRHEGLMLQLEGSVGLQLSARSAGLLDAFSNNIKSLGVTRLLSYVPKLLPGDIKLPFSREKDKDDEADSPITLVNTCVELAAAGRMPAGLTEIPFEVPLAARGGGGGAGGGAGGGRALLETYHGVFVNVMYSLKATMKRSFLNKPLHASCQLFVQYPHQEAAPAKPVRCEITPASIRAGGGGGGGSGGGRRASHAHMPSFHIYAEIDSTVCALDKPITGMVRVDECSVPIKSIELQLVRVETCGAGGAGAGGAGAADGVSRDATEIQNIQVGSGDVRRGRALPLHMVLPRLFTCPTTATHNFKIEFELNIAVIFEDDYLITENFPILLLRSR